MRYLVCVDDSDPCAAEAMQWIEVPAPGSEFPELAPSDFVYIYSWGFGVVFTFFLLGWGLGIAKGMIRKI